MPTATPRAPQANGPQPERPRARSHRRPRRCESPAMGTHKSRFPMACPQTAHATSQGCRRRSMARVLPGTAARGQGGPAHRASRTAIPGPEDAGQPIPLCAAREAVSSRSAKSRVCVPTAPSHSRAARPSAPAPQVSGAAAAKEGPSGRLSAPQWTREPGPESRARPPPAAPLPGAGPIR